MMNAKFLMLLSWVIAASLPGWGQDKLYPVRGNKNVPVILTSDRSAFVIERAFQHKLTLGFPPDDRAAYFPETRTQLVVLWLRIQNVSRGPLGLDVTKFTGADDQGGMYAALSPEEALNRILAGVSGGSIGAKALRGISLGRAANQRTEDDVRDDILRYSLHSSEIPAGSSREGFIYFEAPRRNKFTFNVVLGDLWSQPLLFSTQKQK